MSAKKPQRNGNLAFRPSSKRSKTPKPAPLEKLGQLLAAVYDRYQTIDDPTLNARHKRNFVFHMTDWMEDLHRLAELYKHPDKFDAKSAGDVVAGFLFHVIPHLRAAGRLALDYTPEDIFLEIDDTSG